ncbi:hypothetical protein SPRG_09834 [Saprolegnia parasitica CBS 223.65]|uniref:Uncharacterized protein n=1 Tax=Saprolegnia parasitica (strain CBS 223.65) TaxID=695850 RepID=A0A067C0W9_SAPPC|nr:hypothetical protein SPRG_09834 [Saprolegnia parasitica CBS 223.65]KDO24444.1 hypothetical protein SPRG_09834 [Saprolegnia parasitica CBS 223.65]|eukprot:XP_012204874.1 hypothetical protein SPRG_09834 [Saprolegnia parasitica CBS 223.65]
MTTHRLLLTLLVLLTTVDSAAGSTTTPTPTLSACQECANTGRCLTAGSVGDAGKYCGVFFLNTTVKALGPCCCSVAQICPTPGHDTVCACASVQSAAPYVPSYDYSWVYILASTVAPFLLFYPGFLLWNAVDSCITRCRERREERKRQKAARQREADVQAARERREAAARQLVVVTEVPGARYVAHATPVYPK